MDVGVGLPMQSLSGEELAGFARRVEAGPFASVSLGQRLTFDSNDPMIALTFVAAVTTRLRMMTSILCLPFHKEGVVAQQAATLDKLSTGRFSLGLGLGGRPADFAAAPAEWAGRGEVFERQLVALRRNWEGLPAREGTEPVGPRPFSPGGPEVIIGASAPVALRRAGRLADGLRSFSFSASADEHLERYAIVTDAWREAGRPGRPRLVGASNFALGPDADAVYRRHVDHYYGYDPQLVHRALSATPPTSPEAIRAIIRQHADAGVDELVFTTTTSDWGESLDRLADVVSSV